MCEQKSEQTSKDEEQKLLVSLWSKYEDVAMHFNDLLMRLRTQALGALAGIVTIAGFVMEGGVSDGGGTLPWKSILVGSLALLGAWVMVFLLDTFYYSKLLLGAVDALLELESKSKESIVLSTRIDGRFCRLSRRRRRGEHRAAVNLAAILLFYAPVAVLLGLLVCFARQQVGGDHIWT